MPTPAETKPLRGPAAAVKPALTATEPIVHLWRDGLTSHRARIPDSLTAHPDYLTFDQATAEDVGSRRRPSRRCRPWRPSSVRPRCWSWAATPSSAAHGTKPSSTSASCSRPRRQRPFLSHAWSWADGTRVATSARPAPLTTGCGACGRAEQVVLPAVCGGPGSHLARDRGAPARASMASPTQALHDVYAGEEATVDDIVRAFPMPAGSRGVAIRPLRSAGGPGPLQLADAGAPVGSFGWFERRVRAARPTAIAAGVAPAQTRR